MDNTQKDCMIEQRSYIKIETLHGKNSTEIHGALSEVCDMLTLNHSKVSLWANHFRGGYMIIDNEPNPGRPRTSTDEINVKLVADALEEDRSATCEEISRATGAKPSQENAHGPPHLLVAGPLILHGNARPHIADVVTKKVVIIIGKCYLLRRTVQT